MFVHVSCPRAGTYTVFRHNILTKLKANRGSSGVALFVSKAWADSTQ